MSLPRTICGLLLAGAVALSAAAQQRRDPLTAAETNQLRDSAQDPPRRISLYVKYVRERATRLEQLAADPRYLDDRAGQMHDQLADLVALLDEMDDNVQRYGEKYDIRKPLRDAVALDTDLVAKLKGISSLPAAGKPAPEAQSYAFVLRDALDAAESSLIAARSTLADQEERARHKKK